uniref:Uncharacterized protein n=1 Tax=Anguilla anguilla TaxID=7936 RepID=A0A0E9SJY5_ANGAN
MCDLEATEFNGTHPCWSSLPWLRCWHFLRTSAPMFVQP